MKIQDQRQGTPRRRARQQLHNFPAQARIKIRDRLIGQQDFRLLGEGARDGHALLFAAGKCGGTLVEFSLHPHLFEDS